MKLSTGTIDTLFTLDPSASRDAEDRNDRLMVRWDYDGDETWDTGWIPKDQIEAHQYTTPGIYQVGIEVRDPQGATASSKEDLHVTQPIA